MKKRNEVTISVLLSALVVLGASGCHELRSDVAACKYFLTPEIRSMSELVHLQKPRGQTAYLRGTETVSIKAVDGSTPRNIAPASQRSQLIELTAGPHRIDVKISVQTADVRRPYIYTVSKFEYEGPVDFLADPGRVYGIDWNTLHARQPDLREQKIPLHVWVVDETRWIREQQGPAYKRYCQGVERAARGQFLEARIVFEQTLQLDPHYSLPREGLSIIRSVTDQAITAEAATQLFQGHLHLSQWRWAEAIAAYTSVIGDNPQYAPVYVARAWVHMNLNQADKALADLNQALALDPQLVSAYTSRANLMIAFSDVRDLKRAMQDINRAREIDPRSYDSYIASAAAHLAKRRYDQALADYTKAIELRPTDPDAYRLRAGIYEYQGWRSRSRKLYYEKALADYTKAIELDPENMWAYLKRAFFVSQRLEDPGKACADACADWKRACELGRCLGQNSSYMQAKLRGECE